MKRLMQSACAALALVAASLVQAHPVWMLPSEFNVSASEAWWITVDASVSHSVFHPDGPIGLDTLQITTPKGERLPSVPFAKGKRRSVFDLQLSDEGTYLAELRLPVRYVTTYQQGARNTVRRMLGLKQALQAQIPEGAREVKTTAYHIVSRFYVTRKAPTRTVMLPTGKGIELLPVTHPADIVVGEPAIFRLTRDGQPLAGVEIELVPHGTYYRNDRRQTLLKTDAAGEVRFVPAMMGPHLMTVPVEVASTNPQVDAESMLFYLSFEALGQ